MFKICNGNVTVFNLNDVTVIEIDVYTRSLNWEQYVLITSDVHIDNVSFKKALFKKHMDKALELNAPIIDNGDLFDCMGGKYDSRSNKADVIPVLQVSNYFDALVNYAANILNPYKNNIAIMSYGNHELSILNKHEINLTKNLVEKLGGEIIVQKYTGCVFFKFKMKNNATSKTTRSLCIKMYRTHGFGNNSPVTKGVIQTARRQEMILADIYISGHIHTEYVMSRPMWYWDSEGNMKIRTPIHKQIGTFKDSTLKSWEDSKGFPPPSIGAAWLKFSYNKEGNISYSFVDIV